MPQLLVAIQLPDDFDPSSVDPAMERDIDVLNEEIVAAGIGVFVGGLRPAREAKSLRAQPDGKVLITDGPYLETKEHIGGFWVIEVATWTKRWRGHARASSLAGYRSRCGPFGGPATTERRGRTCW